MTKFIECPDCGYLCLDSNLWCDICLAKLHMNVKKGKQLKLQEIKDLTTLKP